MTAITTIRAAASADEAFLGEMQYQALFVPPGDDPYPASTVHEPGIARYWVGFGTRPGDIGRIAELGGEAIGAAWVRQSPADDPGYGFIDDKTPELGIAVVADHRGTGVGSALLADLLVEVPRVSLSVDARNAAYRLYERNRFVVMSRSGISLTMLRAG